MDSNMFNYTFIMHINSYWFSSQKKKISYWFAKKNYTLKTSFYQFTSISNSSLLEEFNSL